MEFKDHHKILGVNEDADAKAIKTAYRKLARKYHPDVSKESTAAEHLKEVTEAFEVLKSPEKPAEYDELRRYEQSGQCRPPPSWQAGGGAGMSGGAFALPSRPAVRPGRGYASRVAVCR